MIFFFLATNFVIKPERIKWTVAFHTEKSNKIQQFVKIYYSIFTGSLTCFGRHTAHHQEPKIALATSGFCIRRRLLDVWLQDAVSVLQPHVQQPST